MKKPYSSQNSAVLVPLQQDVALNAAIVGEANEIGSAPRMIAPSKPVAAAPVFRLLQKRLRRERRSV